MVAPPIQRSTRVRISKSGQMTLPSQIREQLGVDLGDQVDIVQLKSGEIEIRPVKILSADEISGKFGKTVDPEEMKAALKEAREDGMVRQRYKDGSVFDDLG